MISLDLMKSSEVRKAGDRSKYLEIMSEWLVAMASWQKGKVIGITLSKQYKA